MEDALEVSFDRQVDEGAQRLGRSWREILVTGAVGGIEVSIGVLAFLVVLHDTGSHLLAGIAFAAGFIALLLGHSELFTEGFLVPVVTVAAKRATVRQMLKLWSGTLVANLVGGWLIMWLVVLAFPSLCEGFGLVITEAMAHGLPVITTPNTVGRDLIEHGRNGFLVPIRDPDALAQTMAWCLDHRGELERVGREAARAAAAWQWDDYRRALAGALVTATEIGSTSTVAGG